MEVILRTGFGKVIHSLPLNPRSEIKGKKLLDAGHVLQVEELRKNGVSCIIRCRVVRQTSVTAEPYSTQLFLNAAREVERATCTCVYANSEICKHVVALITFVNTEESVSKTNNEQSWGKPSVREFGKNKYSKGKYFDEMRPPKKKVKTYEPIACDLLDPSILKERGLCDPSPLRAAVIQMQKDPKELAKEFSEKMAKRNEEKIAKTLLLREQCKAMLKTLPLFFEEGNQEVFTNVSITIDDPDHALFYQRKIVLNEKQIIELACLTIDQSGCKEWFKARNLRITASKNVHSIKSRKRKSIPSLVEDITNPKKLDVANTKYGKATEPRAKQVYSEIYGEKLVDVGVLVSKFQPWLSVSIDAAVVENNKITKILEIKSASSCKKRPVVDYEKQTCNVKYLSIEKNVVKLVKSHVYYTQCQVMLYVTGLEKCEFFVYSPVKSCRVTVLKDRKFLEAVILNCEIFYFKYVLPDLYLKNTKENNGLVNELH